MIIIKNQFIQHQRIGECLTPDFTNLYKLPNFSTFLKDQKEKNISNTIMIKFTIPIAHEVLNKFNSSSIYFMKKIVADLKSKLNHRAGN